MAQANKSAKKPRAKAQKNDTVQSDKPAREKSVVIEDAVVLENAPAANRAGIGRGVLPLVIGGIAAGAIGFGAALALRDAPEAVVVDNSAAEQKLGELADQIAALNAQDTVLKQAVADGPSQVLIDALNKRLDRLDRLSDEQTEAGALLSGRLSEIEDRPAPKLGLAANSGEAQAATLRAEIAALAARMANLENAQAVAPGISAAQRAYVVVAAAVDSGAPFGGALAELAQSGVQVPADLVAVAGTGVVTLGELQSAFPDAARAALNAVGRAGSDDGIGSKLGAFLRVQLGARSLEPREGGDADAILSRAEAALRTGDIAASVQEAEALPDAGGKAMANWVELARARLAVEAALVALSVTVGN